MKNSMITVCVILMSSIDWYWC